MNMFGYEHVIDKLRRSTVQVLNARGGGSGFVWDSNCRIVTNAHVVTARQTEIVDASGQRHPARVTKRDEDRDLALIEVDGSGLDPAAIGDSGSLHLGQIVFAMGHPLGIHAAAAAGIIHAIGPLGFGARKNWIQADIRLAPGNSGGILADAAGRVIGVNTMIFHGIGLAIPVNEVNQFVLGGAWRAKAA